MGVPKGTMRETLHSQTYEASAARPGADSRVAPRFALMLRSAKLIADGAEYLCITRDVSETGLKLRLFHPLPQAGSLQLETASGARYPMELVWESGGEAGFRFLRPIDVDGFIAEGGPFPKRPVRLKVSHPAVLESGGQGIAATILDISRQGARVETAARLAIGQKLRIRARELPAFDAVVCWRREPHYGLVFGQIMTLEELAQRASRMERNAVDDTPPGAPRRSV